MKNKPSKIIKTSEQITVHLHSNFHSIEIFAYFVLIKIQISTVLFHMYIVNKIERLEEKENDKIDQKRQNKQCCPVVRCVLFYINRLAYFSNMKVLKKYECTSH